MKKLFKNKVLLLLLVLVFSITVGGCEHSQKDNQDNSTTQVEVQEETSTNITDKDETSDVKTEDTSDNSQTPEAASTPTEAAPTPTQEATPTPTEAVPTPTEAAKTLPDFEELVAHLEASNYLDTNFKANIMFGCDAEITAEGLSMDFGMEMNIGTVSYDDTSYTESYAVVNMFGVKEEMIEKTYTINNHDTKTATVYSYEDPDEGWITYNIDYNVPEIDGIDTDFNEIELSMFKNIDIKAEGNTIVVTAVADSNELADMMEVTEMFGIDENTEGLKLYYVMTFDADSYDLMNIEITCNLSEVITKGVVDENNMMINDISDMIIIFEPNFVPVEVPDEVKQNAKKMDDEQNTSYNDFDNDVIDNESIGKEVLHKGWSDFYNTYSDSKGEFPVYVNNDEVNITVSGKDNWFFDNTLNSATYVAVRDDSVNTYRPAYEADYSDSYLKVNLESIERVLVRLLSADYDQNCTSADIKQLTINGKACYYLVTSRNTWGTDICVLQDIGTDDYIEINIQYNGEDLNVDAAKLVQMFALDISMPAE